MPCKSRRSSPGTPCTCTPRWSKQASRQCWGCQQLYDHRGSRRSTGEGVSRGRGKKGCSKPQWGEGQGEQLGTEATGQVALAHSGDGRQRENPGARHRCAPLAPTVVSLPPTPRFSTVVLVAAPLHPAAWGKSQTSTVAESAESWLIAGATSTCASAVASSAPREKAAMVNSATSTPRRRASRSSAGTRVPG